MGLDDLFENHDKHRRQHGYSEHEHHNGYNYAGRHADYKHQQHQYLNYFLSKIWSNRKLRLLAILFAFIVIVLVLLLIAALIPLLHKLLDFVMRNGVQGVLDFITSFIDNLWKGTGKAI